MGSLMTGSTYVAFSVLYSSLGQSQKRRGASCLIRRAACHKSCIGLLRLSLALTTLARHRVRFMFRLQNVKAQKREFLIQAFYLAVCPIFWFLPNPFGYRIPNFMILDCRVPVYDTNRLLKTEERQRIA